jgi:hypothetical protein
MENFIKVHFTEDKEYLRKRSDHYANLCVQWMHYQEMYDGLPNDDIQIKEITKRHIDINLIRVLKNSDGFILRELVYNL